MNLREATMLVGADERSAHMQTLNEGAQATKGPQADAFFDEPVLEESIDFDIPLIDYSNMGKSTITMESDDESILSKAHKYLTKDHEGIREHIHKDGKYRLRAKLAAGGALGAAAMDLVLVLDQQQLHHLLLIE